MWQTSCLVLVKTTKSSVLLGTWSKIFRSKRTRHSPFTLFTSTPSLDSLNWSGGQEVVTGSFILQLDRRASAATVRIRLERTPYHFTGCMQPVFLFFSLLSPSLFTLSAEETWATLQEKSRSASEELKYRTSKQIFSKKSLPHGPNKKNW